MTKLDLPIENLSGVGSRNLSRLHKLGIKTVKDLLWHFPTRYEDYSQFISISSLEPGQKVSIRGEILNINTKRIFPRRLSVTNAVIGDDTGAVKVAWFNQPYIEETLPPGTLVNIAGKVSLSKKNGVYISSPTYEKHSNQALKHTGGLIPTYPETHGLTSKYLRYLVKPLLGKVEIEDPIPHSLLLKYSLPDIKTAIQNIHYPLERNKAEEAKKRFAFSDLLLLQLKSLLERRKLNQLKSAPIPFQQELIKTFIQKLPFELTKDQKVAAWEILQDLSKTYPMNRLMEGDVGSGKTVVALIAAYQAAKSGHQVVFLAPTEVLAQQHFKTAASLLGVSLLEGNKIFGDETAIKVGLLTGSEAAINGRKVKKSEFKIEAQKGNINIIVGTHAIIQKDVIFNKLALVVIDEQHRFGVDQRANLVKNKDIVPHLLSMTATPIPRTLALTIYGDLDISIIKEKPKNRQKIITKIISPKERTGAYKFIHNQVKAGRQIFVVCPRIEINDQAEATLASSKTRQTKMNNLWAEVKAVEEEYKKLSQEIFPDLRVTMLHGRMKAKDKTQIMDDFKNRKSDILVTTSVIEVGVDVPNATVMMIESAERFGLAQLHQFRGRVGRAEHQSHCLLFTSSPELSANQRLKALETCDDGFELAEKDMTIRGPGEFFGVKQSGLPDLAMASLADVDLIKKARLEARTILKEDPSLKKYPLLKEGVEQLQRITHFE